MIHDKTQITQYESTRRAGQSVTRMIIPWKYNRITFEVEGKISMKLRRTICLAIYRSVKEINRAGSADIQHKDGHYMSQFNEIARPKSLVQTVGFATLNEKIGATIRLQRLQANWTLEDLSQHGQFKPQARTLMNIQQAFKLRRLAKAQDHG